MSYTLSLFQVIISSVQYPTFLDHSMKIFLKILQEGEPHFIGEYNIQVLNTVDSLPYYVTVVVNSKTLKDEVIKMGLNIKRWSNTNPTHICSLLQSIKRLENIKMWEPRLQT